MSTGSYEIYSTIRDSLGYKDSTVAVGTGITKSTFSDWKAGRYTPKTDKMKKIAEFMNISLDYLMSGNEDRPEKMSSLSMKDEKDIAKRLEDTLFTLENSQEALMFSGGPLDDETKELLKISLENSLRIAKINAKQKYTPKKYRE